MSKKILGLDLGTNSIGWALVERDNENNKNEILGLGSRILPMSQDILGKFDAGQSISQTVERTGFRNVRRLLERDLLRRERLHRVLKILDFLPEHYVDGIDFKHHRGQFLKGKEPKLAYRRISSQVFEFIFRDSFNEMIDDFKKNQPSLFFTKKNGQESKIPYDWTIYYLRNKALFKKIEKEELAWILLQFNQKRGYYQQRGEDENSDESKSVKYYSLKIDKVEAAEPGKSQNEMWYNIYLENGWVYRRIGKTSLDWEGKQKEFIVTEELNEDGTTRRGNDGKEKRNIKAVDSQKDWIAIKKSTEEKIEQSGNMVGSYIYKKLLQKPDQKIRGKLIRTIERSFYREELKAILTAQMKYHPELSNTELYKASLEELYPFNESHKNDIAGKNFTYLFIDDIIFYQRSLKSKKFLISDCPLERKEFTTKNGELKSVSIKCIARSHPLFQEFRLLQFLNNLKIFKKGEFEDIEVTQELIPGEEEKFRLYSWLNDKSEIDQESLLKYFGLKKDAGQYRWNYVEDKRYALNETRGEILKRINKLGVSMEWLTSEREENLWHILYSVEDRTELEKALKTFARKNETDDSFVEVFNKFPRIEKEYGTYSAKAIKKLLPLMRFGKDWNEEVIAENMKLYHQNIRETVERIDKKEFKKDAKQNWIIKVKTKLLNLGDDLYAYRNLPKGVASYLVYKRDSEVGTAKYWKGAKDIELLKQHSLRNPVIEHVINETLRTVKDIWAKFGDGETNFFDEIHLEMGRVMKNHASKRAKMTKQIAEDENTNLRIKALLLELMNDKTIENVRPSSSMQQEILKLYEEGVYGNETNKKTLEAIDRIRKQKQPTVSELKRYKLWLQEGYLSPYTGKIIPLNKLFTTAYEIDHIIPQSRFFDDSFNNKTICEAEVNSIKDNQLAYEFIRNNQGIKIELNGGHFVTLLTLSDYEENVKKHFANSKNKMKKLLMKDLPETFIERELNDSHYICRVVKSLLSNILREEGETEETAKNLIVSTGTITATLRQDWGLNDMWTELITPRFKRLNQLTRSEKFGSMNPKTSKFLPEVPLEWSRGFSEKRIDHRHHALDALVVACSSCNHINYINNESAREKNKREKFELRNKLRKLETIKARRWEQGQWVSREITIAKEFLKPWPDFTKNAKDALENVIVSFKKNNRVINKMVNHYQNWINQDDGTIKKGFTKQVKGDRWAIRKPLHKDSVWGLVTLPLKKQVAISFAIDNFEKIVDKELRSKIEELMNKGNDKNKITKYFKELQNSFNDKDISCVEIYYSSNDNRKEKLAALRVPLDESFNEKKIGDITDSGIQKVLIMHLNNYKGIKDKKGKEIAPETLAFSANGIDTLNKNIRNLNGEVSHQPIYKVRTYERFGNKFNIGVTGNKKDKYVEAAKGTNLFFAIYVDEKGKRVFETIPLNIVIQNQKIGGINRIKPWNSSVPKQNEFGDKLLFCLSPNDLIYIASEEERKRPELVSFDRLESKNINRIYKIVSFTGNRLYGIPVNTAKSIVEKLEFTQLNKIEFTDDKFSIKEHCWKLETDRLGEIKNVIKG